MSEQNNSRRKLLKSIAAGSGAVIAGKSLPDSWSKPVVDSVLLPVHAQTSCVPCLVAALYCEGQGGITVDVAVDGTVTVTHPNMDPSPQTDTVDPCAGGAFSVTAPHNSGNGSVTIAGSIPCGTPTEITVTENGGDPIVLTTAFCG